AANSRENRLQLLFGIAHILDTETGTLFNIFCMDGEQRVDMTTNLHINPQDRLLILAVHPDDETLGCGGLIQQAIAAGASVHVAFITNGDNNPWPQRYVENTWKISSMDRKRWGHRRQAEALDALAVLGVKKSNAIFLGLPDQGMTSLLETGADEVITLL